MASEHQPSRAILPLGWIIAFSGFGLLVTIVFVVMVIGGVRRRVAHRTEMVITAPLLAEAHRAPVVQSGSINIGDQFGIAVQKEDAGQRARADRIWRSAPQTYNCEWQH